MKRLKSLTLPISDIVAIFSITDSAVRDEAIRILETESADPENTDPERYADADPIIYNLVSKIYKCVVKARRRAESVARRKAEKAAKDAEPKTGSAKALRQAAETAVRQLLQNSPEIVNLSLFKNVRDIILDRSVNPAIHWLYDNLYTPFRYIKDTFRAISYFTPLGYHISNTVTRMIDAISVFLIAYGKTYSAHFGWKSDPPLFPIA